MSVQQEKHDKETKQLQLETSVLVQLHVDFFLVARRLDPKTVDRVVITDDQKLDEPHSKMAGIWGKRTRDM